MRSVNKNYEQRIITASFLSTRSSYTLTQAKIQPLGKLMDRMICYQGGVARYSGASYKS